MIGLLHFDHPYLVIPRDTFFFLFVYPGVVGTCVIAHFYENLACDSVKSKNTHC